MVSRKGICAFLLLTVWCAEVVWAAFGPCEIIIPSGFSDTIDCGPLVPPGGHVGCQGEVVITVQQKACMGLDESACTEFQIDALVTYDPKVVVNQVGPCHSPPSSVMVFWECQQDLSTRAVSGNGTNC